jgi:phthalate 4,5-dioxygenase
MLNREDNELLTRVGPGTPMGELFRRFWLPAVLTDELETPDGPPVRLRILGEDLLAFRDTTGRVGIIEAYCSHRGAPLFFGRNEDAGIRCPYHGWKFDVDGHCLEQPNVTVAGDRDTGAMKIAAAIKAYATREAGGIVWVYMGPREQMPELPALEWTRLPRAQCHSSRWLQRSNWLQGAEGEIDTAHVSFLHRDHQPATSLIQPTGANLATDGAPVITVKETLYGFMSAARRTLGDQYFWRVSQWMVPMFSLIPRAPSEYFESGGGRAWVPVDDFNTTTFAYSFRVDRPLDAAELKMASEGAHFPPRMRKGTVQLEAGHRIDTFLPLADSENDYLVDRERQRSVNFTGIFGVNEQDRAMQESLRSESGFRGIVDRSRERLVRSDVAIVTARRRLLSMVRALQNGIEPAEASRPEAFAVRAISKITPLASLDAFLDAHGHESRAAPASIA